MNEKVRKTISQYHALLGRDSGKKVSRIEDLLSLNSFSRIESHAMKVSAGETKIDRSARRVDNSWRADEVCRITLWEEQTQEGGRVPGENCLKHC